MFDLGAPQKTMIDDKLQQNWSTLHSSLDRSEVSGSAPKRPESLQFEDPDKPRATEMDKASAKLGGDQTPSIFTAAELVVITPSWATT
jgi:hypothetical protein